jgi:hypothetical protein
MHLDVLQHISFRLDRVVLQYLREDCRVGYELIVVQRRAQFNFAENMPDSLPIQCVIDRGRLQKRSIYVEYDCVHSYS